MKKRKKVFKSIVARIMTLVMAAVMIPGSMSTVPARAEGGIYPYMIFAASDEEGAVTLCANNMGFNGSVATNGTIAVTGGNCNINGTRTERAGEDTESGQVTGDPLLMPDIRERIENTYFAAGTQEHVGDYALEEININVDTPIEGDGKVSLSGNINLNAGIMAQEDIVLDGEVKNSGDVVLYSVSGNIVIDSGNVNLNGLVYAPYGEIRITSMNVNMNNVILIAQKVTIEANGVNGGMNQGMAQFIGTEYDVIGGGTGSESPGNPENPDPENPNPENPDPENPSVPRDPEELMQGIIRYEATEGLEDIGEAYFKDITSLDDIGYTIEGFPCVKNQLLLTSKEGIAFSQIEELTHSYDAEIVGYLELTDDYQIEFYEEITPERLFSLKEELAQNELIERCDYNLSAKIDCDFYTNDAEWSSQNWNGSWPSGKNWNIELIDLEGALVNAGVISANAANADFSDLSVLTPVRIGLIDTAFDEWHEDLDYAMVWNNYNSNADLVAAASLSENATLKLYHGNHVAGIMAAGYNNGKGITGICLKPSLYGFSMYGNTLSDAVTWETTMKLQYALELMIGNHVKVINYSWSNSSYTFAASQGKQYAINFFNQRTDKINEFLVGLIDKGYDFLIVTVAGNENNQCYYKYTFTHQEIPEERYVRVSDYHRLDKPSKYYEGVDITITYGAPNSNATISCNEVNAEFSNVFSYSQDSRVQERVIVVGAIAEPYGNPRVYNVTDFSNIGSRVDILAPGDEILSCMISGMGLDYDYKPGTSMAAPHVSGVAGLAWNVNPDISAPELRDIILNNYQTTIDEYAVLNAADVIGAVVQYEAPEEDEEYTVQLHVTDAAGNGVSNASVELHDRSFYWCKVLGAAMRNDAVGGTIVYSGKTDATGNIKLDILPGNYYVLVDGGNGGVLDEIYVSNEDIIERSVKEITLPDYQTDETRGIILQLSSSAAGENVNPYGLIMNAEIRFIKGWVDTSGEKNIRIEDYVAEQELMADGRETVAVFPTRADFGDIDAYLPEGIYTVEVTLPDAEPRYYHIIISDKYDFTFYRFEI